MKFLKMLSLAAVAAAALMAFTGSASATELTSPSGTKYSGEIAASLKSGTESALKSNFIGEVKCSASSVAGSITNTGSSSETVKGNITTLTFGTCNGTVTVLSKGTLEVHNISGTSNGTLTSSGAEVTVELAGLHCIYSTSNTDIGVVTGGTTATFKAESATIPRTGGRSFALCGSSATWKAEYVVNTPDTLLVDSGGGGGGGGGGGKTSTTTTTSLSGESKSGAEITVNEGSKVKDTATLSGTNAGKATGTVKYKVYADKECKELVTSAGEVTVSGGSVPASEEKTLEAGRVYYWQAEYSGDSSNEASKSSCGKEVLTVKASTLLATSLSGEGKSGEEITILEGSKVKDTATLSGTRSSSATGKVKFKAYKDKECKELAAEAGEGSLSEGKASSEEKTLEAGRVYYWQAEYPGDSLHAGSTSACTEKLTVKATTSIATSLYAEEEEEPIEGSEITVLDDTGVKDKAILSSTNTATATGTVKYSVYADEECKEQVTSAGEGIVEGAEVGSSEEEQLEEEGTYYWQAEYEGDALHSASVSVCGMEIEHANPEFKVLAGGTTTLKGEPLPPDNPPASFSFGSGSIICKGVVYTDSIAGNAPELRLAPTYTECEGWGAWGTFGTAKVEPNGCKFKLNRPARLAGGLDKGTLYETKGGIVNCGSTKMMFKTPETNPTCEMEIEARDGTNAGFWAENTDGPKSLRVVPRLGFSYVIKKTGMGCGFIQGVGATQNNGYFSGEFELKGEGTPSNLGIG